MTVPGRHRRRRGRQDARDRRALRHRIGRQLRLRRRGRRRAAAQQQQHGNAPRGARVRTPFPALVRADFPMVHVSAFCPARSRGSAPDTQLRETLQLRQRLIGVLTRFLMLRGNFS